MTRETETRSKLIAHITSAPGWVLPEPQAAVSIETAVAFALSFADAEAAAMRERAAGVATDIQAQMKEAMQQRGISSDALVGIVSMSQVADAIAAAIRALPATGEVGR